MPPLFHTVKDLDRESQTLRDRPYGMIEMSQGRLVGVHLRPWPKIFSAPESPWFGGGCRQRASGDRCWVYYNQPRACPAYLTLKFMVSSSRCSFMTVRRALIALDWIAKFKESDAIVCEAFNLRISDRLLRRFGWTRHLENSRRRHYIKRFYGVFPTLPDMKIWSRPDDSIAINESECAELLEA